MSSDGNDAEENDPPIFRETQDGFWRMQLVTEVRPEGVFVRFEPLHQTFRSFAFESIDTVRRTSYSAIDYGGWHWGVRVGPTGNTVYRMTGDDGIELLTEDGNQIFIGSHRPAEFEAAITEHAPV